MDEETPYMHLVFLPVVHTTDKKGNKIDKLACSEFWKGKEKIVIENCKMLFMIIWYLIILIY